MSSLKHIKNQIIEKYPSIDFTDISYVDDLTLTFKGLNHKSYYFMLTVSKDVKFAFIGAKLNGHPDNQYYWHIDRDYVSLDSNFENEVLDFLLDMIDILVNHHTRIIQRKGLLFQNFTLEYMDNYWIRLSSNKGLRYSKLLFPKTVKRKVIYE